MCVRVRACLLCVCVWLCVCIFRGVSHIFNVSSHQLKTQVAISQINSCNTFLDTTQSTANATESKAVSNTISQHLHRIHCEDSANARHTFKFTNACLIHYHNAQTRMFWSLFIFREHSTRSPASIGCNDLCYSAGKQRKLR